MRSICLAIGILIGATCATEAVAGEGPSGPVAQAVSWAPPAALSPATDLAPRGMRAIETGFTRERAPSVGSQLATWGAVIALQASGVKGGGWRDTTGDIGKGTLPALPPDGGAPHGYFYQATR